MDSELDSFFAEIKEIDTDAPTGEDALTPGPKLSSSSVAASGSVQPAVPSQMTVAAAPTALASVTAVSAAPSATITVAAKPPMPQASNEGNKAQLIAQEDAAQRQHPAAGAVGYSSNRNSGLAQFLGHPQQGHTEHYMSGAQQGYEYGHQQPHDYQLQSQQQQYSFQTEYQGHRGQGNVIGVAVTAGSAGSGVAAGVRAGAAGGVAPPQAPRQEKKFVRKAAGETWVDDTLQEWPENDYRIFVGDIGKEVSNDMLAKTFQHYKSFAKAKVLRTKHENKARGFGFVSFLDPMDCAKAIREMNGKYLASRPMKIRKSTWKDRDIKEVQKKEKKKRKLEESLGLS